MLKNNTPIITFLFFLSFGSVANQIIDVSVGSYFFNPGHIVVKIDTPVEISLTKEAGFVPHNIVVSDPDNNVIFEQDIIKEKSIVVFTPEKIGNYKMYCSNRLLFFKSHRDKGMEGVIQVVK